MTTRQTLHMYVRFLDRVVVLRDSGTLTYRCSFNTKVLSSNECIVSAQNGFQGHLQQPIYGTSTSAKNTVVPSPIQNSTLNAMS